MGHKVGRESSRLLDNLARHLNVSVLNGLDSDDFSPQQFLQSADSLSPLLLGLRISTQSNPIPGQESWEMRVAAVWGGGGWTEDALLTPIKCDNECESFGKLSSISQTVLRSTDMSHYSPGHDDVCWKRQKN